MKYISKEEFNHMLDDMVYFGNCTREIAEYELGKRFAIRKEIKCGHYQCPHFRVCVSDTGPQCSDPNCELNNKEV